MLYLLCQILDGLASLLNIWWKIAVKYGKEVPQWRPSSVRFSIHLGPYFMSQLDRIGPLFLLKKIRLSLSHLVSEILWPTLGQIFHQMYYLTIIKYFASIYSLIYDPVDPLVSLVLDLTNPACLQNVRANWLHFLLYAEPPRSDYTDDGLLQFFLI